ncbi:hypothetical protein HGG76_26515 [Ochrobactrum tritici]|uniref:Uncharacterized protein n=1 Tax=Brucella tritici TaxID=94626 RepID=A0A7X6FSK8_9HYPH|nr:hypothetical protein [Brucella tritici]
MVKQVAVIGQHLEALQKLPALRNGPDHYARALENAGDRVSESAARTIEARGQALERVTGDLRDFVRAAPSAGTGLVALGRGHGRPGRRRAVDVVPSARSARIGRYGRSLNRHERRPLECGNLAHAVGKPRRLAQPGRGQQSCARQSGGTCGVRRAAAKAKKEQRCTVTVAVPSGQER